MYVNDNLASVEQALDALPHPITPLDVSALDGFLVGVLLQTKPVPEARWWAVALDPDQSLPATVDLQALAVQLQTSQAKPNLLALLRQRHAELARAIATRQWFDPWVFDVEADAEQAEDTDAALGSPISAALGPWVAGFATAMHHFPALMDLQDEALSEPLALLYAHLDPEDLEDADELLAAIDELEPPADLTEGVEDLVSATLLLADLTRPRAAAKPRRPVGPATGSARGRRR